MAGAFDMPGAEEGTGRAQAVKDRLTALRVKMKEAGVGLTLIYDADPHNSEYVNEYYRVREFFSGFTGSAGTLAVTEESAYLFTDGRYFIQAEEELRGTGISLMKIGEPGVPKLRDFIPQTMKEGEVFGFDGRLLSESFCRDLAESYRKHRDGRDLLLQDCFDPAEGIWTDRPELKSHPLFNVPLSCAGEDTEKKLSRIREKTRENGASIHVLSTLDDIAWILNLRGNDIAYCPLFYAYMVITEEDLFLYTDADLSSFTDEESTGYREDLSALSVFPYADFWTDGISRINEKEEQGILLDPERVSSAVFGKIRKDAHVVEKKAPSEFLKAVKNESELKALEEAHIKDGIAVLRFARSLSERFKEPVGDEGTYTELDAAAEIEAYRKEQEDFIENSFETISAYGEHGAVVHYAPDVKSDIPVREGSFLLVDSGGHYLQGTTDITRTFAIGEVTDKMKEHYTLVLVSMLRLLNAKFLKGTGGRGLDLIAREPFWEKGLDYKHGTGHGIGFLLNVHEGPQSIRWKADPEKITYDIFEPGMVTSDEPGIYIAGSYGIRIENVMVCEKQYENEFGEFLGFRSLTVVPVDLSAVDPAFMTDTDIENLNAYHAYVREKLSPYLSGDDLTFLKNATLPVTREGFL